MGNIYTKISLTELANERHLCTTISIREFIKWLVLLILPIYFNALERTTELGIVCHVHENLCLIYTKISFNALERTTLLGAVNVNLSLIITAEARTEFVISSEGGSGGVKKSNIHFSFTNST